MRLIHPDYLLDIPQGDASWNIAISAHPASRSPPSASAPAPSAAQGPLFGAWGNTDAPEARRLVDICLEAGVNLFDTADVYSNGASEEVLGAAIKGRRDKVLISTKTSLPMGDGPNDAGSSRQRLIAAVEARAAAARHRLHRPAAAPCLRRA